MFSILLAASLASTIPPAPEPCEIGLVVLGAGQDAGAPQIGMKLDVGPALLATSLGIADRRTGRRYLFEATPDMRAQYREMSWHSPPWTDDAVKLDGIFLTHAHIGHYTGLMYLGFESANSKDIPVFAMPRMASYLATNGPWSQLVEYRNIALQPIENSVPVVLEEDITVTPLLVPHRDEFSETVGYSVRTPGRSLFFLPDIDNLEQWEAEGGPSLETLLEQHDFVFLDSTFFDDDELARDMSLIPHPRTRAVMDRLAPLPASERAKLHFIHYNHSNPIRDPNSPESREIDEAGFHVARRGQVHCLLD